MSKFEKYIQFVHVIQQKNKTKLLTIFIYFNAIAKSALRLKSKLKFMNKNSDFYCFVLRLDISFVDNFLYAWLKFLCSADFDDG